ncbi:helix-turn-helix domain-containing protein, partial [Aetokthonos hydrillicola]
TPEVATMAKAALYSLRRLLDNPPDKITFGINEPSVANAEITLSGETFRLITEILETISNGHPVMILPLQAELSTQEAANILNVSRPYVIKLLEQGIIPSRKVGVYRRILASDVLQYKQHNEAARHQALDELTKQAQELDMGY